MFILLRCGLWLAGLSCLSAAPATPSLTSVNKAMTYLTHFGYLSPADSDPQSGQILSKEIFTRAIQEFQEFSGINVTGVVDQETEQLMSRPRCGIKDKMGVESSARNNLLWPTTENKWTKRDLTYKISKYSRQLDKAVVDEVIQDALEVWASVTPLTFTRKDSGRVDIDIRFEQGQHASSCESFDGPNNVLAHAFFPPVGDAHFDDSEKWTVKTNQGTNLFQVAAHEFGHSLGLDHSNVRSALMYATYLSYDPNFKLDRDDVERIQYLYGKKGTGGSGSDSGNKPPPSGDEDGFYSDGNGVFYPDDNGDYYNDNGLDYFFNFN